MELNFLECLMLGLVSGLADILPVSAQAHKAMLLTLFGAGEEPMLLRLLMHIGIFAALYFVCKNQLVRINRQLKLARIPKKRRKRPVDMKTIMDYKMMQMMVIPVVIGFLFIQKTSSMNHSISWAALFMLINAVILFLPQLLPSGNKDSRSMSRLESLMMGAAGALGVFPGISSVGAMTAVASVCGAERTYALNISLMMNMVIQLLLIFFDLLAIVTGGFGKVTIGILLCGIVAAAAAFVAVNVGVRVMRTLASGRGYYVFAWYSLAMAALMFILYLMV